MIKIGYYIKNQTLKEKIWELVALDHEFLLYELKDGTMEEASELKSDLIIFDFYPNDSHLFEYFVSLKQQNHIRGICILESYTDELIQMILSHHIQYFCDFDIRIQTLYVMCLSALSADGKLKMSLYERIERVCRLHSVPVHLKGFDYLKSAIVYYVENEKREFRMKDLYDTIAKRHHTTSSRVEKNMRMAIQQSGSTLSNSKFIYECFRECANG